MARVFTTSFEYNYQRYDAIVTIIAQGEQLNFSVKLLDADLHDFFPNGIINYSGANGLEPIEAARNNASQLLIKRIGEAINSHLQTP